jgi:hypothetical protein
VKEEVMQIKHGQRFWRGVGVGGVAVMLALPATAAFGKTAIHHDAAHDVTKLNAMGEDFVAGTSEVATNASSQRLPGGTPNASTVTGGATITASVWANEYVWRPTPAGDFTLSGAAQIVGPGSTGQMFALLALDNSGNGVGVFTTTPTGSISRTRFAVRLAGAEVDFPHATGAHHHPGNRPALPSRGAGTAAQTT